MKNFGLLAIVLACGLILTGCELFHEPEVCCTVEIDDNENNEKNTNLDANTRIGNNGSKIKTNIK